MNLKNTVGDKHPVYSGYYLAYVGADLFAHGVSLVRINSHLQVHQLHFP